MTDINKVSEKDLDVEFKVVVSVEDFNKAMEEELKNQQKKIKIDGFRKGKVPLDFIKNKYSALVLSETAESLVDNNIAKIIKENKYELVKRPDVKIDTLEEGKPFEFTAKFLLLPKLPKIKYSNIKLKKHQAEVKKEEIEKGKVNVLKNFTEWKEQDKEYKSKLGDKVKINFLGKLEGEPFEGGKGENFDLELGTKSFIDNFEDQLVGFSSGDKVEVKVNFPEKYHSEKLAGQPATFDVEIISITSPENPELTDEFIKENLGFENVEEMENEISKELEKIYNRISTSKLKNQIFEWLKDNVKFTIPEFILEDEFNARWKKVETELEKNPEKFKNEKEKEAEKKKIKKEAEESVRLGFILSQIGKDNNIQVQNNEVIDEVRIKSAMFPGQEQMFMNFYMNNKEALKQITAEILENKVIEFVADNSTLEVIIVPAEELSKI